MNIGLLVCEDTPPYATFFRDLLDGTSRGGEITLHPYKAYEGDLPSDVRDHEGYLITGSRAGVYEDLPWIGSLLTFVGEAHGAAVPQVGVCFGHQVLAHALGGRVEKAGAGWELGIHGTAITRHFPWMDGAAAGADAERLNLVYVHQDQVVSLPKGATPFAATDLCPVAGFVIGGIPDAPAALGIQGHPEFSPAATEEIIRTQPEKFPPPVADPALHSLASHGDEVDSAVVAEWITRFLLTAGGRR